MPFHSKAHDFEFLIKKKKKKIHLSPKDPIFWNHLIDNDKFA